MPFSFVLWALMRPFEANVMQPWVAAGIQMGRAWMRARWPSVILNRSAVVLLSLCHQSSWFESIYSVFQVIVHELSLFFQSFSPPPSRLMLWLILHQISLISGRTLIPMQHNQQKQYSYNSVDLHILLFGSTLVSGHSLWFRWHQILFSAEKCRKVSVEWKATHHYHAKKTTPSSLSTWPPPKASLFSLSNAFGHFLQLFCLKLMVTPKRKLHASLREARGLFMQQCATIIILWNPFFMCEKLETK